MALLTSLSLVRPSVCRTSHLSCHITATLGELTTLLVSLPVFPLRTPIPELPCPSLRALISNIPTIFRVPAGPTAGFLSHPYLVKGLPGCLPGKLEASVAPLSPSLTPAHVQWSLRPKDCALPAPVPPRRHPALLSPGSSSSPTCTLALVS